MLIYNLESYDAHLIERALGKRHGRTRVIAQNFEKYMSFSVGRLQFLDSMQFMPGSLETLVQTLSTHEVRFSKI